MHVCILTEVRFRLSKIKDERMKCKCGLSNGSLLMLTVHTLIYILGKSPFLGDQ